MSVWDILGGWVSVGDSFFCWVEGLAAGACLQEGKNLVVTRPGATAGLCYWVDTFEFWLMV